MSIATPSTFVPALTSATTPEYPFLAVEMAQCGSYPGRSAWREGATAGSFSVESLCSERKSRSGDSSSTSLSV